MAEISPLPKDLSEDEQRELASRHYVRKGEDLVWLELGGAVRREPVASLYYIRTERGVFRVSRMNGRVIEV
jgi:hypothetical protein